MAFGSQVMRGLWPLCRRGSPCLSSSTSLLRSQNRFFSSDSDEVAFNVMYGSQSGTALFFSKQLMKEIPKRGGSGTLVNLNEFHPSLLVEGKLNVFVMATFGKGEPTDNARLFCEWLFSKDREGEQDFFQNVHFSMFGLGMSSTYKENYQRIPRDVTERLIQLGATLEGVRGEGDDSKDIDDDFDQWLSAQFWPLFEKTKSTPQKQVVAGKEGEKPTKSTSSTMMPSSPLPLSQVPISKIRVLTGDRKYRVTKHFEFDITDFPDLWNYTTGDYVSIYPPNLPSDIEKCVSLLKCKKDTPVTFEGETLPLSEALNKVDLAAAPKRSFLRTMAEMTEDRREREDLLELGSTIPADTSFSHYNEYILKDNRGVVDVMADHPAVSLTPEMLLDNLPARKPRLYSIANAPEEGIIQEKDGQSRRFLSICMRIIWGAANDGRPFYGKVSHYLDHSLIGSKIKMQITPSSLRLPENPRKPVILMGIGTGISALRAFWQQRCIIDPKRLPSYEIGPTLLFFGCDSAQDDFYFDELTSLVDEGKLEMHQTFALLESDPRFIQNEIRVNGERLANLILDDGAHLYLCGHKLFSDGVIRALRDVFVQDRGMTRREAEAALERMISQNRLEKEIFE